ncbi:hypothetical protein BY996DRAFT_4549001, partial [Phakopsora pachyrhizi]
DHLTWLNWHKAQASNPYVPNHDPNDLGVPPPPDLIARRPKRDKAEPSLCPVKMKLPKKINTENHDEL